MTRKEKTKLRKKLRWQIKAEKQEAKYRLKKVAGLEARLAKLSKMRPGGGRAKGNSFENQVANVVVAAFEELGIQKSDCYRTPLSGGHRFARKTNPGDLVMTKRLRRLFPFVSECKCYKDIDMFPLLLPEKKRPKSWEMGKWLSQVSRDCPKNSGLHPLLIFKKNSSEILCALPELVPLVSGMQRKVQFKFGKSTWYVLRFKDLLNYLRKEHANASLKDV